MKKTNKRFEYQKSERKNQIALAGLKVFCEKGYDNATVDDIVKKANCSHGLFYHYYKSKKEIFEEVLNSIRENKNQELFTEIDKIESYPEKLRFLTEHLFYELKNDENFAYHYYFFVSQMFTHKDKCPPPKKPDFKPPFMVLEEFFEKGQKKGEFSLTQSPKECARLYISIVQGATIGYVIAPKEVQKVMEFPSTDFIIDIFKKGVN